MGYCIALLLIIVGCQKEEEKDTDEEKREAPRPKSEEKKSKESWASPCRDKWHGNYNFVMRKIFNTIPSTHDPMSINHGTFYACCSVLAEKWQQDAHRFCRPWHCTK